MTHTWEPFAQAVHNDARLAEDSPVPGSHDVGGSWRARIPPLNFQNCAWAVLIVITLYVCYFSHLGAFGLIGPDEPRYAWIARDMAESGDWVTPRLYGQPWFEKPALYYWAAALSFKLLGASEATARLPSALFALLATFALAWLALRLAGWELARWVLLLLPTSVGMIGFSHAAATDMAFGATLATAMVAAAVALGVAPSSMTMSVRATMLERWLSLLLFGFFLGCAVLAKGPAAVILAGCAVSLWAVATKHWRDVLPLLHPIAVYSFLVTCLPWYVLCARRNPDFLRIFIVEHNFKRFLTPEFQHIQPLWFYLPITVIALLPWISWLAWFTLRPAREATVPMVRSQLFFVAAWGLFPVLFFSLSKSKLPGYILPAVPPLALLISWSVVRSANARNHFHRYALGIPGVLFMASAGWVLFSKTSGTLIYVYVFIAVMGGLLVSYLAVRRKTEATLIASVIVLLLLLTVVYVSLAKLDGQLSARMAAAKIEARQLPQTYAFKLQRGTQYQLNFYLRREVPEWTPQISSEAVVVTRKQDLHELADQAQIIGIISEVSPQAEIVTVRPRALP